MSLTAPVGSGGRVLADLEVLPHPRIDLDEDDVLAASDHRPVWVDLAV